MNYMPYMSQGVNREMSHYSRIYQHPERTPGAEAGGEERGKYE